MKVLEDTFAAAALTEADLDTARRFMAEQEVLEARRSNVKEKSRIGRMVDSFEQSFAAAGIAEGDPELARRYLSYDRDVKTVSWFSPYIARIKEFVASFENVFAAAAMTEGSQDMALGFLKGDKKATNRRTLDGFLQTVGLKGVPVRYGIAVV